MHNRFCVHVFYNVCKHILKRLKTLFLHKDNPTTTAAVLNVNFYGVYIFEVIKIDILLRISLFLHIDIYMVVCMYICMYLMYYELFHFIVDIAKSF